MDGIYKLDNGKFRTQYWSRDLKKVIYIGTWESYEEARDKRNEHLAKVYSGEIDENTYVPYRELPKGVYVSGEGRYTARLAFLNNSGDKTITRHIGTFDTAEEASKVRTKFIEDLI